MGAVTRTSADLEAHGLVVTVSTDGDCRVKLDAPASIVPDVRVALAWRREAMAALLARRHGRPAWACPTLSARPGLVRGRGACPSCGEAHASRGNAGDCYLCIAARIAVLRDAGRLPAVEPATRPAPPAPPAGAPVGIARREAACPS